jgi:RNA polymerase sigma-70 factor (ECF subfamily)
LLQEALGQLTEKRKEIFLLRMEENLSLDEIAARLSISKNVVKKQLYAAIASIRDYIHRQGGVSAGLLMLLIKML